MVLGLEILLAISLCGNLWLWLKRPHKHIKVKEQLPGVWAHTLKTRKASTGVLAKNGDKQ
jgi:hypothetical protein